jgi:hypothetical protein
VEVLVASVIGVLVSIGALSMWQGNLRATTSLLRGQSLRDNWSRVNLFINADISEACSAAAAGGVLTLRITRDTPPPRVCTVDTDVATVTYQVTGANNVLQRTGPPIQRNGSLDLATGTAATLDNLVTGATFDPACTTAFQGCYDLTLTSGTTTFTDTGFASAGRTRVRAYP